MVKQVRPDERGSLPPDCMSLPAATGRERLCIANGRSCKVPRKLESTEADGREWNRALIDTAPLLFDAFYCVSYYVS